MIIGSVINMSSESLYTPPIARGGTIGMITVDALQVSGTAPTLSIDVEHKNYADLTFTSLTAFPAITATGLTTVQVDDAKEQIRFRWMLGGASGDWMRIFLRPASWMDQ